MRVVGRVVGCVVEWIRSIPPALLIFQMLGWATYLAWVFPGSLKNIMAFGVADWLYYVGLVAVPIPFVMVIALRLGAARPTDLLSHRLRFLGMLFVGSLIGEMIHSFGRSGLQKTLEELSLFHLISSTIHVMIISGIFGWLSLLYLQRMEDQVKFTALMIRRSMLARQVAQSRLLAARAQIDPETVVRILRSVRIRYPQNSTDASSLLDHLISYLRLAMNRVGEQRPSLSSEIALARSYLGLREAESGVRIDLQVNEEAHVADRQSFPSLPLFLIIRRLHDEVTHAHAVEVRINVDAQTSQVVLALEIASPQFDLEEVTRVRKRITELSFDGICTLQHTFDSGVNRYVAQITAN